MAESIFSNEELLFLKALNDLKVDYMLVGLSAAALQGAPVVTQDIDLWLADITDNKIRDALKKVGTTFVPQIGLNLPAIAGGGAELFDIVLNMHGIKTFEEELENTKIIKIENLPVRVLNLDRIIASKEFLNREKDHLVLPVLKQVFETIKAKDQT